MIELVASQLDRIPGTFWGVVAGSLFTLIGVIITNRAHDRRLDRQLRHDRDAKRLDRDLALRKEIYVGAAEAVSAGLTYLSKLIDLSLPLQTLAQDYFAKQPAIAKVHIVATEDTARALAQFSALFTKVMFGLITLRQPLEQKSNQAKLMMEEISEHRASADALIIQARDRGLAGTAQNEELLRSNLTFHREELVRLVNEHRELLTSLMNEQVRFASHCKAEISKVTSLLIPLLAAVRAELGVPFDRPTFERIFLDVQAEIDEAAQKLFHEIGAPGQS